MLFINCTLADYQKNKPVVDMARDAQCCVHTRDSSCRGQTHRWMDRHCATIRASLACASRANSTKSADMQHWPPISQCQLRRLTINQCLLLANQLIIDASLQCRLKQTICNRKIVHSYHGSCLKVHRT